jgi:hypothetical protein
VEDKRVTAAVVGLGDAADDDDVIACVMGGF